jgi:hypothetical protein
LASTPADAGVVAQQTRVAAWFPMRALSNVLLLAAVAIVAVAAVVLGVLGGWDYYSTPLRVRGYDDAHRLLRPSGTAGHLMGILGVVLMLAMQLYTVRKRRPRSRWPGSLSFWLEFHIFCGLLGPALITFHTSLRFNGIVSVAYWSMVLVMASGFVGRYLYVRIPKTIRGTEVSVSEIEEHTRELKQTLAATALPAALLLRIEGFEAREAQHSGQLPTWSGLIFGEVALRFRLRALRRAVARSGVDRTVLHDTLALVAERAFLVRRIAYLRLTKKLFDVWHVLHKPLAYLMLVIVALHIATALYFGYAFGG